MPGLTRNEMSALVFLAAAFLIGVIARSQGSRLIPVPDAAVAFQNEPVVVDSIRVEPSALVSINHATKSELERLPGVGPVLAERIIQYRESRKGFRSLKELTKVRGIGDKKLAMLSSRIRLD
jgi:competence protein ComEA